MGKKISVRANRIPIISMEDLTKQVIDLYDDFCMIDREVINCDVYSGKLKIKILLECREYYDKIVLKVTHV